MAVSFTKIKKDKLQHATLSTWPKIIVLGSKLASAQPDFSAKNTLLPKRFDSLMIIQITIVATFYIFGHNVLKAQIFWLFFIRILAISCGKCLKTRLLNADIFGRGESSQ